MEFEITHRVFPNSVEHFNEHTAPDWLTGIKTRRGSTMDDRWFWNDHVLKLEVGQTIETDFRIIKRLA